MSVRGLIPKLIGARMASLSERAPDDSCFTARGRSEFLRTGQHLGCAQKLARRCSDKPFSFWRALRRRRSRQSDSRPTTSWRWASRSRYRGALPPPDVRRLCRAAQRARARRLASRCLANCSAAPRLLREQASTWTCSRYSSRCSPTTSWPSTIVYYHETPLRVPKAAGGRATACAGCFLCACSCRADRARKPELWRASGARSGTCGGAVARS
eukprot:3541265-Prymnesium_polylepis.1